MVATVKDVLELQGRVQEREEEIRGVFKVAGVPLDEVTLLALLAIVHITFVFGVLQAEEIEPEYEMAKEIFEAKKKGVM